MSSVGDWARYQQSLNEQSNRQIFENIQRMEQDRKRKKEEEQTQKLRAMEKERWNKREKKHAISKSNDEQKSNKKEKTSRQEKLSRGVTFLEKEANKLEEKLKQNRQSLQQHEQNKINLNADLVVLQERLNRKGSKNILCFETRKIKKLKRTIESKQQAINFSETSIIRLQTKEKQLEEKIIIKKDLLQVKRKELNSLIDNQQQVFQIQQSYGTPGSSK